MNRNRSTVLALTAAALLAPAGCMDFDGFDEELELTTQVGDWRDEVIYQVMVDRFADGDRGNNQLVNTTDLARYQGGDWRGLENRLGYLEELGVTTLWISPVIRNVETDANVDGYHGYWAVDLEQPNPHFGNLSRLRSLVAAAHERDMKVIFDIVTNHVGQVFYYDMNLNGVPDINIQGNGEASPVRHFTEFDPDFDPRGIQAFTSLGEAGPAPVTFQYDPATGHIPPLPELLQDPVVYNRRGRTVNFEDPDQLLHGDFPGGLKDLDTTRCDIKQMMVDSYANWIELTDADGFRIDTVKHVEGEFWRFFTQRVRQRLADKGKTNFLMFGEIFDGRDDLIGSFTKNELPSEEELAREQSCATDGVPITGDQLDSTFYFSQHFQAIRDVFQNAQGTDRIAALWADRVVNYGLEPAAMGVGLAPAEIPINFIDNHDVPRFLYELRTRPPEVQRQLLRNALVFTTTAQGIPCLYYGTEQEFDGGNDPANREPLWDSGFDTQGATFQFTKRVLGLRRAYAPLRRGSLGVVWATPRTGDESDAGILAFERVAGDGYVLVILNSNQDHASTPRFEGMGMALTAAPGTVLVDVLASDGQAQIVASDGSLDIVVPPMSAVILVPEGQRVSGV